MYDFTTLNEINSRLKDNIKKSLAQNPAIYDLWFDSMQVLKMTDMILFISVQTEIQKVNIETRYKEMLTDAIKNEYGLDLKIVIYFTQYEKVTKEQIDADEKKILLADIDDNAINSAGKKTVLGLNPKSVYGSFNNPTKKHGGIADDETDSDDDETVKEFRDKYTFGNFVVGSSNRFAYKACTVVAEYPAVKYNPFFIYGPPGLGKTHLLCAISNEYGRRFSHAKVIYVNGEDFANELIDALAKNNRQVMQNFKEKYRTCDMLLIDDIQFIAGKVSTQEEFFHTFNALYEAGKQIIFTADRPPKDMKTLEERLTSRFEWGLIVDIQPPDLELRSAILKRKSEDMSIKIPNEVLFFLAENISSNIRQIEGVIKKLNAYAYLNNSGITLELAKASIADILSGTEPINVTVEKVLSAVSQAFGVPQAELKGRKRTKEIALARNVAIYIIRSITDLSLPAIGKIFGRDHSTVFSAIGVIENEVENNAILSNQITEISNLAKI